MSTAIPSWFVVCMGIGTVFFGLVCIILLCMVMSHFIRLFPETKKEKNTAPAPSVAAPAFANRGEVIAAITAAIAEENGENTEAIRIVSIKKV